MYKKKRGRKKVRSNVVINFKCEKCGSEVEAFENSLCGDLRLCKECIAKIWGTNEFLERIENCNSFSEEDIKFYERLFRKQKNRIKR
ncbi:MAG: hypothetical protein OH319_05145 [Candidatus Parvarchaeota archaeon]|nr:hypothetical protein [Candidatus Jingweiarchaeum tengchongense]